MNALPHCLGEEQTVLGSALIDRQCREIALQQLDGTDFYQPSHKAVFLALCRYPRIDTDLIDLQRLADLTGNQADSLPLLAELTGHITITDNMPYRIQKLKDASARRALIEKFELGIKQAYNLDVPICQQENAPWTAENTVSSWITNELTPYEFVIPGLLAKGVVGFSYGTGGS